MDFSIIEPKADHRPSTSLADRQQPDPLVARLKSEPASLRTEDSTSTYNKFSAVSAGSQRGSFNRSVSVFASGSSDFFSNSSSSDLAGDRLGPEVKVECKTEPMDVEDAVTVKLEAKEEDREEDTMEFLRALRRDW